MEVIRECDIFNDDSAEIVEINPKEDKDNNQKERLVMEFTEKEKAFLEMLLSIANQIVEYTEELPYVEFDSNDLFYLKEKLGLDK